MNIEMIKVALSILVFDLFFQIKSMGGGSSRRGSIMVVPPKKRDTADQANLSVF